MHRATSGLVAAGAAVALSLALGVAAHAATVNADPAPAAIPHPVPVPVPAPGHHHFSAAVTRVGAATTLPDRVKRVEQALQSTSPQLQRAYDVAPLYQNHIDGTGLTIATLVAFGDKNAQSYLDQYDADNGLPAANLQTIEPAGAVPACTAPGVNTGDCQDWGGETDLDITMIHTLAPGAKILIIATPVSETEGITGFPELMSAMYYTVSHHLADVISMSMGTPEDDFASSAQLHGLDGHFKNATDNGVTVLASSGDDGADGMKLDGTTPWGKPVVSFPADEAYVTAVGGTVLSLDDNGNRTRPDSLWPESGGGVSHEFGIPSWQRTTAAATGAAGRALPDVTMEGTSGTSESAPLMAALVGLADQSAGRDLGLINPALYALGPNGSRSGVVDVTSGCNSTASVNGFCARGGYDIASGWGTIDAAKFVPALVTASTPGNSMRVDVWAKGAGHIRVMEKQQ
ncbi:subtilase family serine protease [Catenulispora sp. GP43]|uniref:S53 family peptidase n=1 Tax=Catenulispora sp. GP43 TaxID=3156263 RepID=UPI003511BDA2